MSPQNYQGRAALAARDLSNSNAGSDLNGKNIVLIIFVAIVPVLIVAGAVSWLLCCYSRGRGCGRRKKNNKTTPSPGSPPILGANASTGQKAGRTPMAQTAPSHPAQAHTRNDSISSGESNLGSHKSNVKGPTLPQGFV
ncbi:hypothetical protein P171DRAFT_135187 [Karstenula rhodostoma CBS 690.94]|uniref:Uncharacterized protein n=1 Tax=Karstenula rhodostoma CBS 690.94 TaxID=1392251 RepID=A0A9P4UIB9_9PLEO|nr:hypothetical protein P171DRAFT_135187 [Karstenula rhodostoma CBS 690.94]